MDVEEITTKLKDSIKNKVASVSFDTWFKSIEVLDIEQNTVTMYIDSDFKKNYIIKNDKYIKLLEDILKEITNKDYTFELITDKITEDNEEEYKSPTLSSKEEDIKINREINNNLRKEYRFDNFIVGESNKMAQIVALEVAKNPGKSYNPFFLYGRSGIGKTHLMHAIGNYIVDNSNKTVLYVTSEQFISDFTEMTRREGNEENYDLVKHFKEKYRNIDVLLIDDIQFLGNAPKSQDEFFHTFNELVDHNKQIIISSDRSPNDIKLLEDRLKTRFTQQGIYSINPPELELKIKIIKNKIADHEVAKSIDDKVFEYIAENSPADVRSIEGAINRLYLCILMDQPEKVTLEFAQKSLQDVLSDTQYITNSIAKIRKITAEYYDVTEDSLRSKKRTAIVNKARQVAMYICKISTEETMQKIGLEFNRDHATVIHGCDKIDEDLKTDTELQKEIKEIKEKLHE